MNKYFTASVFVVFFLLNSFRLSAEVHLPKLVGDNMIIQRDTRVNIFGTALRVERVTVVFMNRIYAALPDENSEWVISLPPLPAGGPYEMEIFGKNTLKIHNIMIGEVWLASGQSNMEWKLEDKVTNHQIEIANANYPDIRFIDVKNTISAQAETDFESEGWRACSPKTAGKFSAAAYFFARDVFKTYNVPVGIIQAEWSGTPAEAWVSTTTLKQFPEFKDVAEKLDKCTVNLTELSTVYTTRLEAWKKTVPKLDRGYTDKRPWYEKKIKDEETWKPMKLPCYWETAGLGGYDGVTWFRKEIEVPRSEAGNTLTLCLGKIDNEDITWFNGEKIGETKEANQVRKYTIPGKLVKSGRNVIVVRVNDTHGNGGIWGNPADLKILSPYYSVSLAGEWKYKTAVDVSRMPKYPTELRDQNSPGVLFNGMIEPVIPYTIKGVIWYQGESNATRAYQYRNLFPALIRDWRAAWKQKDDFAFLFVQLANYKAAAPQPGESDWAELREAQTFALNEPNTGMVVSIDIGDANDIHPRNKLDVGKRLFLAARKVAYKDSTVVNAFGPLYKSMTIENNKIHILFDNASGGLKSKNGTLKGFAIAGYDKKFYWANARIDSNTVVVWSEMVPKPTAVRYAWADNPEGCNLYNVEGLPASPFRTDQWQGLTFNAK
ncbi:sialate O-acetylesterase [Cytophagaceae bacterium YF14B1]|uniref:Sialate O-acetylesterase n=1 Tax=Xanthocytophaga flava TaxID=3048013 RepID=A0AAE3QKG4_9BACT|nr:sialate O-acetylesterase [Xanthocytophaga flavus]MDJ1479068.1 sialate O-acetylesterase [Xanthocytophaga flavus]